MVPSLPAGIPVAGTHGAAVGRGAARAGLLTAGYVVAYVALDWVSYVFPIAPFAITPGTPRRG